jgi:hypothetical protein
VTNTEIADKAATALSAWGAPYKTAACSGMSWRGWLRYALSLAQSLQAVLPLAFTGTGGNMTWPFPPFPMPVPANVPPVKFNPDNFEDALI